MTRNLVQGDDIFIVLGDTICEYDIKAVMAESRSMIGLRKVEDPRDFGVAEIDDSGFIEHLVEKPQIPKSNLALVGIYRIKESEQLFRCLENNISQGVRSHGEYSLTDALDCMIGQGISLKSFKVDNWFDCGRKETLLESNALFNTLAAIVCLVVDIERAKALVYLEANLSYKLSSIASSVIANANANVW